MDLPLRDGCRWLSDTEVAYADGAEEELFACVAAAPVEALRSTAEGLSEAATSWPQWYHLSPARANILRAVQIPAGARVLEIGAGCGALTRYLGERCELVDALEPMFPRARVARARTRDLDNVEVHVGELHQTPPVPSYDVVVVVGVLEYVGRGSPDLERYTAFLEEATTRLVDGGMLLVAIENPIGVKYLSGAPEDHSGIPFHSVERYETHPAHARTFPRKVIEAQLRSLGLEPTVLGVFPDYKITRAVLADRLYEKEPTLAAGLPRFPSPDWGHRSRRVAEERAVWDTMLAAGLAGDCANSLLFVATRPGTAAPWPSEQLAVYFQPDRRPAYGSISRITEHEGDVVFERAPLTPSGAGAGDGVQLDLSTRERASGASLLTLLATAPDQRFVELTGAYVQILRELYEEDPEGAFDALPHNVVVADDGRLRLVDAKWRVEGRSLAEVLARAVVVTAPSLRSIPGSRYRNAPIVLIERALGRAFGLPSPRVWRAAAHEAEAAFQRRVSSPRYEQEVMVPMGRLTQLRMHAAWALGSVQAKLPFDLRRILPAELAERVELSSTGLSGSEPAPASSPGSVSAALSGR